MPGIFSTPGLATFSALIALQGAAGFYLNSRQEHVPRAIPLAEFPKTVGGWSMAKEFPTEAEVQAVLQADDTLSRAYVKSGAGQGVYFWIAYFQSQRAGRAPHSPKNCLPGNGWVKEKNSIITVQVPGRAEPIEAQYYLVQRGESKSVVIYWYQSHGRIVATNTRQSIMWWPTRFATTAPIRRWSSSPCRPGRKAPNAHPKSRSKR